MKRVRNIVIIVCMLAVSAALWVQAGPQFMKLQAGAVPLGPEEEFGQAQGQYVSYQAAYPVASCAEEYYSGDADRVRTCGYIVYDEARKAFLYIVVPEQSDGRYANLMHYLGLAVELRAQKDMEPAEATGSLEPMEQADIDRVVQVLEESEIVTFYNEYQGEESYYEAYFGDDYGQVMEEMCRQLARGTAQAEWYRIDCGTINGVAVSDLWICALAVGMSLLIALKCLISLFTGGKAKSGGETAGSGSGMAGFLDAQRIWVEEWCQYCRGRGERSAYLSVAIWVAVMVVIGIVSKTPTERLFTFSLPLGLLLGELTAVLILWIQKGQSKPGKILKRMEKSLRKALPAPGAMDEFAEDFLKAGKEWEFQERKKDTMLYARLGDRYWSAFAGTGLATVVDVARLARVEPETVSGSVRSGKVRVAYESYLAKFYYEGTPAWENGDKAFSFQTESSRDAFLALAGKKRRKA